MKGSTMNVVMGPLQPPISTCKSKNETCNQNSQFLKGNDSMNYKTQETYVYETMGRLNTSLPRRSFTKVATWAKSRFKATKPLFPRFPNNMSGFTTSLEDESQDSFSTSSLRSVDSVIWGASQQKTHHWITVYNIMFGRIKFTSTGIIQLDWLNLKQPS